MNDRGMVVAFQKPTFFKKAQDADVRPGRKSAEEDKASSQRTDRTESQQEMEPEACS